jgi:hypothetical protein
MGADTMRLLDVLFVIAKTVHPRTSNSVQEFWSRLRELRTAHYSRKIRITDMVY